MIVSCDICSNSGLDVETSFIIVDFQHDHPPQPWRGLHLEMDLIRTHKIQLFLNERLIKLRNPNLQSVAVVRYSITKVEVVSAGTMTFKKAATAVCALQIKTFHPKYIEWIFKLCSDDHNDHIREWIISAFSPKRKQLQLTSMLQSAPCFRKLTKKLSWKSRSSKNHIFYVALLIKIVG